MWNLRKAKHKLKNTVTRFMIERGWEEVRDAGKIGQKIYIFRYKINKFWDVIYKMIILNNTILYI